MTERKTEPAAEPRLGWMVQYRDELGYWHDYRWAATEFEERRIVKYLEFHGNHARSVVQAES